MIEDQSSAKDVDPPATEDDPAGEVRLPVGRGALIRAQILAGAVVGAGTALGFLGREVTTTTPTPPFV